MLSLLGAVSAVAAIHTTSDIPNVQIADRSRYTSNPDGILSPATVSAIDLACDSLRRDGKAQIAAVAIDDIDSDDVFSFALQLFSDWGVGSGKGNNGLGIILVRDKGEIRFVTGDGLEGILPDAVCKRIQQRYMIEPFRNGDFDTGMLQGITATASILSGSDVFAESDDDAELEMFKRRKPQYMALDKDGRDVFLADSGYVLQMAQTDFPKIKFYFSSEF